VSASAAAAEIAPIVGRLEAILSTMNQGSFFGLSALAVGSGPYGISQSSISSILRIPESLLLLAELYFVAILKMTASLYLSALYNDIIVVLIGSNGLTHSTNAVFSERIRLPSVIITPFARVLSMLSSAYFRVQNSTVESALSAGKTSSL